MALHLHRSERADPLVAALAGLLATGTPDPFVPEVLAVPARGVERWLTQRLSHHLGATDGADGVSANIDFCSPTRLVAEVVSAAGGVDPDDDPWPEGRSVWTLVEVIDDCIGEDWCAPLARHLAAGSDRRLVAAQHLARLYASYASQRGGLLRDWAAGSDTDGAGHPLPDDLRWQAELWRRLRAAIDVPSPAERRDTACAAVRTDPERVPLPDRLSLFGPTRLTTEQVAVLAALAEHRDVHLWLPHPSAVLWDRLAGLPAVDSRPRRRLDPSAALPAHRLLASLGRDAREMQLLLAEAGPAASDQHHGLEERRDTVLGRLQQDLREDAAPGRSHPVPDADDRSLQVHACHGRARQVEVLREVLLGLLQTDPSLEPRDVLVMCPDIESYAPLISATFGLSTTAERAADPAEHPGHRLRVRLADRSLRQTNPLLATMARLLELADARVTASQVLDLAALAPVRRRFRLDDDDLERIRDWVAGSNVRWGLDAAHRAPYQLAAVPQNTWQAGLDRLLLGVTMAEDDLRWLGLALPLDDVDSTDVDLAGRLAELVARLGTALDSLAGSQPLAAWLEALSEALDTLTAVGTADEWQLAQARRELADVAAGATGRTGVRLRLADVRALLADRLQGRPTRAGFRTGNLTMCSMVPMRSVPHRVICLLGLDDGVFPRSAGVDGDDVLARDPLVGERDRRSEDRQLLLDAVLAAEEHLVILYTGADERTNAVRPPAVPLAELLDAVDASVRDRVVVRHPLQPFDPRNFTAAGPDQAPFSFDQTALAGARAAAGPRRAPASFLADPLPPPSRTAPTDTVELDPLIRFLEHPVRGFLRQRLGVAVPEPGEELDDALHAELDGLQKWAVGDRWVTDRLAGGSVDSCREAAWRRGELPPGRLGSELLAGVIDAAEPLIAAAAPHRMGAPTTADLSVALPSGCRLAGSVGPLSGNTVLRTTYSRLAAKHRVRAWTQLLALAVARPDESWRAVTIGRSGAGVSVAVAVAHAPSGPEAATVLDTLVDLRRRGLCEPLPLPLDPSLAYATVRARGDTEDEARASAARNWADGFDDRDYRTVWGPQPTFGTVLAQRASDADQLPGAAVGETSLFGALSCRLWFPLLAAEAVHRQ